MKVIGQTHDEILMIWFELGPWGIKVEVYTRDGAGWITHGGVLQPDDSIPEAYEPRWWNQINVERFIAHRLRNEIL